MSGDASTLDLLLVAAWALAIGLVFIVAMREWFN